MLVRRLWSFPACPLALSFRLRLIAAAQRDPAVGASQQTLFPSTPHALLQLSKANPSVHDLAAIGAAVVVAQVKPHTDVTPGQYIDGTFPAVTKVLGIPVRAFEWQFSFAFASQSGFACFELD